MIRVLNFFCVALMGLSILALYHVSEHTRVTQMELTKVNREIRETRSSIGVLQTEWAHVAGPARIQELAQSHGMTDAVSAQLSSFDLLPRRGDAPLNNSPVRNASAQMPQSSAPQSSVASSSMAMVRPTLSPQPISDQTGF
jgi:cell division protein FtsL